MALISNIIILGATFGINKLIRLVSNVDDKVLDKIDAYTRDWLQLLCNYIGEGFGCIVCNKKDYPLLQGQEHV